MKQGQKQPQNFGIIPSVFDERFLPSLFRYLPRLEEDNFNSMSSQQRSGLSLAEDEKNVYIEAHLPGVPESNIEVTQDKGVLWIKGQTAEEKQDKQRKYYKKATSSFSYCVAVPENIKDSKEATASYENGVITITYPKKEQEEAKKIPITSKK